MNISKICNGCEPRTLTLYNGQEVCYYQANNMIYLCHRTKNKEALEEILVMVGCLAFALLGTWFLMWLSS